MRLFDLAVPVCLLCVSASAFASIADRKTEFLTARVDWWKAESFPTSRSYEEWKWDEIEPCWAGALAAMSLKRNAEEIARANAYFEVMPIDWDTDPDMRVCEILHTYYLFRDDPAMSKKALGNWEKMLADHPAPRRLGKSIWDFQATENHAFMGHVWRLLAAQIQGDKEEVKAISDHISAFIDEHAKKGWEEFYSPCYVEKEIGCLILVRDWAEQRVLRRKAEMALDLLMLEHALLNMDGVLGGPSTRAYGYDPLSADDEVNHNSRRDGACDGSYPVAYMLFGQGSPHFYGVLGAPLVATSSYEPPEIIRRLACDSEAKGSFELTSRKTGKNRRISVPSNEGVPTDDAFNARVYVWVTPDYLLGSSQEVQCRYGMIPTDMLPVCLNVRGSTRALVFPETGRTNVDVFQHENVVLGRGSAGRAYFALQEIPEKVEQDGWIFLSSGKVFIAFKVVSGGYEWEGVRSPTVYGDYISFERKDSPFVLEVARSADYSGDFARFQRDIMGKKLEAGEDRHGRPYVIYETSGGGSAPSSEVVSIVLRPEDLPVVNGVPEPLHRYPSLDTPFAKSDWDSGVYEVSFDDMRLTLDFSRPLNPRKREWKDQ